VFAILLACVSREERCNDADRYLYESVDDTATQARLDIGATKPGTCTAVKVEAEDDPLSDDIAEVCEDWVDALETLEACQSECTNGRETDAYAECATACGMGGEDTGIAPYVCAYECPGRAWTCG
jgi:hypothetical protein